MRHSPELARQHGPRHGRLTTPEQLAYGRLIIEWKILERRRRDGCVERLSGSVAPDGHETSADLAAGGILCQKGEICGTKGGSNEWLTPAEELDVNIRPYQDLPAAFLNEINQEICSTSKQLNVTPGSEVTPAFADRSPVLDVDLPVIQERAHKPRLQWAHFICVYRLEDDFFVVE